MATDRYARDFGRRVKALRQERGWSRRQLAQRLDVHSAQISRYEGAQGSPSLPVLRAMTEVFQVSADELLFGETAAVSRQFQPLFAAIERLSAEDQRTAKVILEALVLRADVRKKRRNR